MTGPHWSTVVLTGSEPVRPGPRNLVKSLFNDYPLNTRPKRLLEVVASTILKNMWADHENFAAERAESWNTNVKEQLRNKLNELQEIGRPARIVFNSSDSDYVQGACFIEPNDPPRIQEQKRRRSRVDQYQKLIRQLTPEDFEYLCRRVLELFGVRTPYLTRRTADDGIDFFGQLEGESVFFRHDPQPTIQKQLSIWLVGQAKQYARTRTGTPAIRELVGAVTLGRSGSISTNVSPFPRLRIRVGDPVILMLVTSGALSTRAWNLADRSGVIGIDGELLAAFLIDRLPNLGGSPDPTEFQKWLRPSRTSA